MSQEATNEPIQRRALALISGGLDSLLAAKVIQDQGVYVEGINFYTGFCVEGHTHAIRKKDQKKPKRNNALWSAEQLGIKLNIIDISEEYKDIVINPKHGYGANLNPCLDCKIFMVEKANAMLNKAREYAGDKGFDFIITGEVVGQRPKSQRADTLPLIAKDSGAEDYLVRPLCAKNLPATAPEQKGWIDRDKLYDFHGRNRKPQMALAEKLGLQDYAQPAGGCCFLTDEAYSNKLADLWQARGEKTYEIDDIMLLKIGRHLRPKPNFKLIISREEGENNFLEGYRKQFHHIRILSHGGPLTLVDGEPSEADLVYAAQIAARYSQGRDAEKVQVQIERVGQPALVREIVPLRSDEISPSWHV